MDRERFSQGQKRENARTGRGPASPTPRVRILAHFALSAVLLARPGGLIDGCLSATRTRGQACLRSRHPIAAVSTDRVAKRRVHLWAPTANSLAAGEDAGGRYLSGWANTDAIRPPRGLRTTTNSCGSTPPVYLPVADVVVDGPGGRKRSAVHWLSV